MDFNWANIQEKMFLLCKNAFKEDNLTISDDDIRENIIIFNNLNSLRTSVYEFDGFGAEIRKIMQGCYVDEVGEATSANNLATKLDAFMKRLLVLAGYENVNSIPVEKDAFLRLIKALDRHRTMFGTLLDLENAADPVLKSNPYPQYILKKAWEGRNLDTHKSPEWDMAKVLEVVRYCTALYIYLIEKTKSDLLNRHPGLDSMYETEEDGTISDEELTAYNFIAYGNSVQEIKTRYIDCFILLQIYDKEPISEKDLKEATQKFIGESKIQVSITNAIARLERQGKIIRNLDKLSLSKEAKATISQNKTNLQESKTRFMTEFLEELKDYGLDGIASDLKDELKSFLVRNISSVINPGDSVLGAKYPDEFISLLMQKGLSRDKASECFVKIMKLCTVNEVYTRIALGTSLGRKVSLQQFSERVRKLPRNIYLDSNVALPLLCQNSDFGPGKDIQFTIAKSLLDICIKHKNMNLILPEVYVNEIAFQLRRALMLTVWDQVGWKEDFFPTNNVFYAHYKSLKSENNLPQGVESFSNYLRYNFKISAKDLSRDEMTLSFMLKKRVTDRLKHHVIAKGDYIDLTNEEKAISYDVFEDAVKDAGVNKSTFSLDNDVLVGGFLFGEESPYQVFFLSRDRSFYFYRKRYVELYKRGDTDIWLLFNTSRFVNHIDLLNSEFNPQMITEELAAMVENDEDTKGKSLWFADVVNRMTDVPGLSLVERERYIDVVQKAFIGNDGDLSDERSNSRLERLNEFWDDLQEEYHKNNDLRGLYKSLKDEEVFKKIMELIGQYLDSADGDRSKAVAEVMQILKASITEAQTSDMDMDQ